MPPGELTCIKLATVRAQKLHILKVSSFCPCVACLLIALKTILFIEANAITGHATCFGQRIFRVPTRQCNCFLGLVSRALSWFMAVVFSFFEL